jgi:hypothetical protein
VVLVVMRPIFTLTIPGLAVSEVKVTVSVIRPCLRVTVPPPG